MRHEYKHRINYEDYLIIKNRLKYLAKPDAHVGEDGKYEIHSLYFDNLSDKALRENWMVSTGGRSFESDITMRIRTTYGWKKRVRFMDCVTSSQRHLQKRKP